jgi:hypothetical protein
MLPAIHHLELSVNENIKLNKEIKLHYAIIQKANCIQLSRQAGTQNSIQHLHSLNVHRETLLSMKATDAFVDSTTHIQ